ncbi:hypothetical protein ABIE26_003686 [Pedobacter africanus]|uniref:Uncharacterized protein n=1 Tax=Pedobacter africanus TaxID=151894 RepID=A0ACC6L0T4_9SPHI|nr:hypothetical protein [Pedobacter africanus]MDR6784988.1 hypothetical protein [Pedobacter africanus]
MKKDIFVILHSKFGAEEFEIKNARYNLYNPEGNIWEFTLSFDTSAAIKRADKLEKVIDVKPNFEATVIIPPNDLDLQKGRLIYQKEGYDYEREEILSNIYYFEHQSVDDLRIEIVEIKEDKILANVTGKGIVNGSNGNEPDAEFILKEVSFTHDKELFRDVM